MVRPFGYASVAPPISGGPLWRTDKTDGSGSVGFVRSLSRINAYGEMVLEFVKERFKPHPPAGGFCPPLQASSGGSLADAVATSEVPNQRLSRLLDLQSLVNDPRSCHELREFGWIDPDLRVSLGASYLILLKVL